MPKKASAGKMTLKASWPSPEGSRSTRPSLPDSICMVQLSFLENASRSQPMMKPLAASTIAWTLASLPAIEVRSLLG